MPKWNIQPISIPFIPRKSNAAFAEASFKPADPINDRSHALLSAFSHVLSSIEITGDPRAVMANIGKHLRAIKLNCLIADYRPDDDKLAINYLSLPPKLIRGLENLARIKLADFHLPLDDTFLWDVVRNGETIYRPDAFQSTVSLLPGLPLAKLEFIFQAAGMMKGYSVIYAPLRVEEQIMGLLGVWGPGMSDLDLQVVTAFASQLSMALHYAHLYNQAQQRADALVHANSLIAGLNQAASRFEGARDQDRVLTILGSELDKLEMQGIIAGLNPDGVTLSIRYTSFTQSALSQAERVTGIRATDLAIPLDDVNAASVIQTGQPTFIDNVLVMIQRVFPHLPKAVFQQLLHLIGLSEYSRVIYLPLVTENSVHGILSLWGKDLTRSDIPALSLFAYQVGTALDNARLHEETQRQLREQTLLTEAAEIILNSLELTDVAGRLAERLCQAIDATSAYFCMYHLETKSLTVIAEHVTKNATPRESIPDIGESYPDPDLKYYDFLRENKLAIEHYDQPVLRLSDREHITYYGVKSVIFIPLNQLENDRLGVLEIWETRRKRIFTDNELNLCKAIARQAVIAIEKARLYALAQREIAERTAAQTQLKRSEQHYRGLFDNAHDPVILYDPEEGKVLQVNQRACEVYGYQADEWPGMSLQKLGSGYDVHQEQIRQVLESGRYYNYQTVHNRKDGSQIHVEVNLSAVDFEGQRAVQSINRDITDKLQATDQLRYAAYHDRLTGLPNRALFLDRLERVVARFNRNTEHRFAVLFLDLDRFKNVNDSKGHTLGDAMLVEVAARLSQCLRSSDTVARLGGDEFVVLIDEIQNVTDATLLCERIKAQLGRPILLGGEPVFTSASIGVVLSDTITRTPDEYLRDADIAMYRAKNGGRGRFEVFDSAMREQIMQRLDLEKDLRRAIENQELQLYYMPIVRLTSDSIIGFEALLRWQHPEKGLVPPGDFISVAEESGLILPIGRWVLFEACRQMQTWRERFQLANHQRISINLSGEQLNLIDLPAEVREALAETGLPSECLSLEVTESALIKDVEAAIAALTELKKLGINLQLDDFGTGYSSLSYLRQFPIDVIKIDRSFIHSDRNDSKGPDLVRTILLMGKELGMDVVAEGIETGDQALRLRNLGCQYGQGFFFSLPLDAENTERLILHQQTSWLAQAPRLQVADRQITVPWVETHK